MKKIPLIIATVLLVCGTAILIKGQDKSCPEISFSFPPGRILSGQSGRWSIQRDVLREIPNAKLIWSVQGGEILEGQGTATITLRNTGGPHSLPYITLTIEGLPDSCPKTYADNPIVDPDPVTRKIGEVRTLGMGAYKDELNWLAIALNEDPLANGYVFLGHGRNSTADEISSREAEFLASLKTSVIDTKKIDPSRITIVTTTSNMPLIEFWVVPLGANNPMCEACEINPSNSLVCPTITVTGPAGVSIPGEVVTFSANVEGKGLEKVAYRWSAVHGEIVDGQGTLSVKVRMPANIESTLTVTIELVGLPEGCPKSASESAPVTCICAAILIDEFEIKVNRIDEIRLRNALRTNKLDSYDQLYIIEYFPRKVSEAAIRKRQNKLRLFLAKEISRDIASVTIVTAEAVTDKASMKVYFVPPGAMNPAP